MDVLPVHFEFDRAGAVDPARVDSPPIVDEDYVGLWICDGVQGAFGLVAFGLVALGLALGLIVGLVVSRLVCCLDSTSITLFAPGCQRC